MKNLQKAWLFLAVIGLVGMMSCGGSSKPETVAEKYVKVFYSGDWGSLKSLVTEDAAEKMGDLDDAQNQEIRELFKGIGKEIESYKAVETTFNEDETEADVMIEITTKDGQKTQKKVELEKEDGQWKVDSFEAK